MKLFKKHRRTLTPEQIKEVRKVYQNKCCEDCYWCQAVISWWCMNPQAFKARGTRIPGQLHCPYWYPDKKYIRRQIKTIK